MSEKPTPEKNFLADVLDKYGGALAIGFGISCFSIICILVIAIVLIDQGH